MITLTQELKDMISTYCSYSGPILKIESLRSELKEQARKSIVEVQSINAVHGILNPHWEDLLQYLIVAKECLGYERLEYLLSKKNPCIMDLKKSNYDCIEGREAELTRALASLKVQREKIADIVVDYTYDGVSESCYKLLNHYSTESPMFVMAQKVQTVSEWFETENLDRLTLAIIKDTKSFPNGTYTPETMHCYYLLQTMVNLCDIEITYDTYILHMIAHMLLVENQIAAGKLDHTQTEQWIDNLYVCRNQLIMVENQIDDTLEELRTHGHKKGYVEDHGIIEKIKTTQAEHFWKVNHKVYMTT